MKCAGCGYTFRMGEQSCPYCGSVNDVLQKQADDLRRQQLDMRHQQLDMRHEELDRREAALVMREQRQEQWQQQPQQETVQAARIYVEDAVQGFGSRAISPRSRLLALLLCLFFGNFGIHRLYLGKVGTGILWILTHGFFFIGSFADACSLLFGNPTDSQGRLLKWK